MAWVQRLKAVLDAAQPAVFAGPDGRTYVRIVSPGGIPMVLPAERRVRAGADTESSAP